MPKSYYTFEKFVAENNYFAIDQNVDYATVAPQFFHNGFNLGPEWFNRWIMKNGYSVEPNTEDPNFVNVYAEDQWIGTFHHYKGKIYTNKTLQELHESVEIDPSAFEVESIKESKKNPADLETTKKAAQLIIPAFEKAFKERNVSLNNDSLEEGSFDLDIDSSGESDAGSYSVTDKGDIYNDDFTGSYLIGNIKDAEAKLVKGFKKALQQKKSDLAKKE